MASDATGIMVVFFLILALLFFAVICLSFAFWIWMIVDCAKRNFKTDGEKVAWILVIVFVGILGAAIYYFAARKPAKKHLR